MILKGNLLNFLSLVWSSSHIPALQDGPKNSEAAFILSSLIVSSSLQSLGITTASKY